ncbi:hypothetical protein [Lewinella sp. 4G2]|uniref:hypothetical protein n=1 Tax=Lewinella sp. 4G2 TaxID=1803372 RepID=UPI0012F72F17|nr:hypothetical protein [Lewinella sp. 4G2]
MPSRLLLLLTIICSLLACEPTETKVNIRLTMAERSVLDTRIVAYMDSLRPILKANCVEETPDRVAVATDSIVQRRLEEEARMRARMPELRGQ